MLHEEMITLLFWDLYKTHTQNLQNVILYTKIEHLTKYILKLEQTELQQLQYLLLQDSFP
jgi:hypothetical protein